MFKIELENRDFRKSLYFYIVDAGKKKKKKNKKNNELRLGAGIILNQELTYSRHWGKWAAGACQRPDIYTGDRRFSGNLWKSATSSPPELKEIETWQTTHFEDN